MKSLIYLFLAMMLSFLISLFSCRILIDLQKSKKHGQKINIYLDSKHQNKRATPTLGGVGILLGILLTSSIYFINYFSLKYICGLILVLGFGIVGLIDDFLKIKTSYKGLSSSIRIISEILISLIVYFLLDSNYVLDDSFYLNINNYLPLGFIFIIGFVFLLVGSANAMNLTDGLDSLAGGLSLIMIGSMIILCLRKNELELLFLLVQIYGGTLGFLVYNINPAKMFMGDSGSLPLGVILGYSSFILKSELLLIVLSFILVIETLSVISQVAFYKLTGKRLFLMTPFHHHLELKGMKETSIVIIFYIISITLAFIAIMIGY